MGYDFRSELNNQGSQFNIIQDNVENAIAVDFSRDIQLLSFIFLIPKPDCGISFTIKIN